MQGRGEEIASLQSDFYRDKFRKTLRWLLISIILMLILIIAMIYTILFRKEPNYYANTTDGIILSMPKPEIS
jgi:hypothetical protein